MRSEKQCQRQLFAKLSTIFVYYFPHWRGRAWVFSNISKICFSPHRGHFTLELLFSMSFSMQLSKWSLWFCHSLTSAPDTPFSRASPWWLFNQMNGQLQSSIEWVKHNGSCLFSFLLSLSVYRLSGNRWGFPQMHLLFEIIHTFG